MRCRRSVESARARESTENKKAFSFFRSTRTTSFDGVAQTAFRKVILFLSDRVDSAAVFSFPRPRRTRRVRASGAQRNVRALTHLSAAVKLCGPRDYIQLAAASPAGLAAERTRRRNEKLNTADNDETNNNNKIEECVFTYVVH